jgi:hypothetical protein
VNKFDGKRKPTAEHNNATTTAERRRLGHIVHDDRGSASLEWRDAPEDYERPAFRIEGTGVRDELAVKNEDTFNPYDRTPDTATTLGGNSGRRAKRDLRKLSEWVKMMRAMEERKKRGED